MPQIFRVALDTPLRRLFDYLPPAAPTLSPTVGVRVRVPFGRQRPIGLVAAVTETSEIPAERLKPILEVLDAMPLLDDGLQELLRWGAPIRPPSSPTSKRAATATRSGSRCPRGVWMSAMCPCRCDRRRGAAAGSGCGEWPVLTLTVRQAQRCGGGPDVCGATCPPWGPGACPWPWPRA